MSVLVRNVINNKYFIFAKGSPEKMLSKCLNIIPGSDNSKAYIKMFKTLSLNGFRTIGMAYKQLKL
jgi:magnesium-transporting ATPase (P-type)